MLKNFRVYKGAIEWYTHVIAMVAAGRILPLPLDVSVSNRYPRLKDAVNSFCRYQILEDDEAVNSATPPSSDRYHISYPSS